MNKTCRGCGAVKPIEDFRWDNKALGRRKSRCGPCENARMREDRKLHGAKRRQLDRTIYARNSDQVYKNNLRLRYGCTPTQIEKITSTAQCDICGRFATDRKLVVDHCHATGKNRGVLCIQCNTGLGQFQDNLLLLKQAICYIESQGFGFFD